MVLSQTRLLQQAIAPDPRQMVRTRGSREHGIDRPAAAIHPRAIAELDNPVRHQEVAAWMSDIDLTCTQRQARPAMLSLKPACL